MTCPFCDGTKTIRSRPAQVCYAEVPEVRGQRRKAGKEPKFVQVRMSASEYSLKICKHILCSLSQLVFLIIIIIIIIIMY